MIKVNGVHCALGAITILQDIDIDVPAGSLVAVVGANGAGKTSLLRTISRLLPIKKGEILFDGKPIKNLRPHELPRNGLVHVPQGRQIVPNLTVEENLYIAADHVSGKLPGDTEERLAREYARFPILKERRTTLGGSISGGEQQMLAIARGLMMNPKVLMLDEPSLGLAPRLVQLILKALRELSESGVAVILVEQAALAALRVADRGYVLQNGRVVLSGPAAELLRDQGLVQGYLG